jgi:hypothetical protein
MRRRRGANPGGIESIPLTTGSQHKENGVHRRSVIHTTTMTAQRMRRLVRRQDRLDLAPEFIGDAPSPLKLFLVDRYFGRDVHG